MGIFEEKYNELMKLVQLDRKIMEEFGQEEQIPIKELSILSVDADWYKNVYMKYADSSDNQLLRNAIMLADTFKGRIEKTGPNETSVIFDINEEWHIQGILFQDESGFYLTNGDDIYPGRIERSGPTETSVIFDVNEEWYVQGVLYQNEPSLYLTNGDQVIWTSKESKLVDFESLIQNQSNN